MSVYKTGTGYGGAGLTDAPKQIAELQRLRITPVAGAAAATKMNVAGLRLADTLVSVLQGTSGTFVDDTANCTIVDTHASGTLTVAAVNDADTCVVDTVTFTFKDTPTAGNHVKRTAGDNTANALALKTAINTYLVRLGSGERYLTSKVKATVSGAVVTVTAVADGTAGNAIVLTGTPTRLAASGSGTLANGTATGGIKSTTDNSSKAMLVVWLDHA
jgi:hypothetical protein